MNVQIINLFKDYFTKVSNLQIRRSKISINDVGKLLIKSNDNSTSRSKVVPQIEGLSIASSSNISYWAAKIYSCSNISLYTDIYDIHMAESKSKDNIRNIAVDGSIITTCISNDSNTLLASSTISALIDIDNRLFTDYKVSHSCNETDVLLQQLDSIGPNDRIIADRNYSNLSFVEKLCDNNIKFVIRSKSNFKIVKEFMSEKKLSKVVMYNGKKLRIIRYKVDKKTRKVILDHYNTNDQEDNLSEFVLITNDNRLSAIECIELYKKRWTIEVSFKFLKQNSNINRPLKIINAKAPNNIIQYTLGMSFAIYNASMVSKINNDNMCRLKYKKNGNCRFSRCCSNIKKLLDKLLDGDTNIDEFLEKISIGLFKNQNRTVYSESDSIKRCTHTCKKGRYKSRSTIEQSNKKSSD